MTCVDSFRRKTLEKQEEVVRSQQRRLSTAAHADAARAVRHEVLREVFETQRESKRALRGAERGHGTNTRGAQVKRRTSAAYIQRGPRCACVSSTLAAFWVVLFIRHRLPRRQPLPTLRLSPLLCPRDKRPA